MGFWRNLADRINGRDCFLECDGCDDRAAAHQVNDADFAMALIGLGFAGALMVAQPTIEGISVYAILGLANAFFSAARDLSSRRVAAHVPGMIVAISAVVVVMVGASNAVNLTDGLDGLAIVPVAIAAACFALIAYLAGNAVFADYLQINFVPGTGELAVFCGALIGASLGFLWFNAPPAMVFMGDTGSLACGGPLRTLASAMVGAKPDGSPADRRN